MVSNYFLMIFMKKIEVGDLGVKRKLIEGWCKIVLVGDGVEISCRLGENFGGGRDTLCGDVLVEEEFGVEFCWD